MIPVPVPIYSDIFMMTVATVSCNLVNTVSQLQTWTTKTTPTKTAHRQNGPNEGRKRPTQTKTAPTKTAPMEKKQDQNGPSQHPKRPIT